MPRNMIGELPKKHFDTISIGQDLEEGAIESFAQGVELCISHTEYRAYIRNSSMHKGRGEMQLIPAQRPRPQR